MVAYHARDRSSAAPSVTRVRRITAELPDRDVVEEAAALLREGQVVAIPTETVYGLAADATNAAAVLRIFEAKGRPSWNPLIVHIASVDDLHTVARDVPDLARELARHFWPGPLTLVLHRSPQIPDIVTGGRDTVGIRVPDHPVAQAIIRAAGVPLAAPSANPFMAVSPTTAEHVVGGLAGAIPLVVDAGPTRVGIESTVVDLTTAPPQLLRPGGVPREALEALLGPLAAPTLASDGESRASPGMLDRHYAPRARVTLFDRREEAVAASLAARARGERTAVVTWSGPIPGTDAIVMPDDPAAFAARLYQMLHALDEAGVDRAWVERPPATPGWEAVINRLDRAVAH